MLYSNYMTEEAIQKQIGVLKRATERACRSKESARQFLIDAGIIRPDDEEE